MSYDLIHSLLLGCIAVFVRLAPQLLSQFLVFRAISNFIDYFIGGLKIPLLKLIKNSFPQRLSVCIAECDRPGCFTEVGALIDLRQPFTELFQGFGDFFELCAIVLKRIEYF
ncbi:hypothetical protein ES703_101573 [subsurface metagenome]